jgi:hypothetical protein
MATTLIDTQHVTITRFYGGAVRGVMVEVYDKHTKRAYERPATEVERKFVPVMERVDA